MTGEALREALDVWYPNKTWSHLSTIVDAARSIALPILERPDSLWSLVPMTGEQQAVVHRFLDALVADALT